MFTKDIRLSAEIAFAQHQRFMAQAEYNRRCDWLWYICPTGETAVSRHQFGKVWSEVLQNLVNHKGKIEQLN